MNKNINKNNNDIKNIILIGMSGSGKSTLAKIFAEKYNYNLIDTDLEIQNSTQKAISEIFNTHGEKYFRILEHEIIKKISPNKKSIISLGGGSITYKKNISLIKNLGLVIYLFCRPEKIYKNLILDSKNPRPLIKNNSNPIQAIKKLYSQRYNLYKNTCDYIIKNSDSDLNNLAQKLFFLASNI